MARMGLLFRQAALLWWFWWLSAASALRFSESGEFKILQVADMHYANGRTTRCENVTSEQFAGCSDLNTTAFIERLIGAEKPDLIVFTGDNIFASDTIDPRKSLDAAFAPAVASGIPWAAVLGNHDQESALTREGVMKHIVTMKHTLSLLNPPSTTSHNGEEHRIDGFGNYNLEVLGADGSKLQSKSVLNLYFLDSGDYSTVPSIRGYGWIKPSQKVWFQMTSVNLQKNYTSVPEAQSGPAPGLAYFHIPLPEYAQFDSSNFTGVKQDPISSARVVLVTTLMGKRGGLGGQRVVLASLEKDKHDNATWGGVKSIRTWKRLDDAPLSKIDEQTLWQKVPSGYGKRITTSRV